MVEENRMDLPGCPEKYRAAFLYDSHQKMEDTTFLRLLTQGNGLLCYFLDKIFGIGRK